MKKLFLFCFVLFSLNCFADTYIVYVAPDGTEYGASTISNINFSACQKATFKVYVTTPTGYKLCKVNWFDGAFNLYGTTTTNEITIPVTSDYQKISCDAYIGNVIDCSGQIDNSASQLTLRMTPIILATPTASASFNLGCTTPATFTSSITNYTLTAGSYSLHWNLPTGWTNSPQSLSTTVTPDASSSGNVSLSLTLNACAYTSTSANYTVVRTKPTPVLATSNTYTVCNGTSTQSYAVNSICGASSYTYTIQGNSSCVFTTNGLQTITTSNTAVTISFPNGSYSVNLSVVANFPDNTSGSSTTAAIIVGGPDYTKLSIVTSSSSVCPNTPIPFGARYNNGCINSSTSNITNINWYVSPTPTQISYNSGMSGCAAGTNNSSVQIKFASTVTQYSIRISAQNSCGTSAQSNPFTVTIKQTGCGTGFNYKMSPNPTRDYVSLITDDSEVSDLKNLPMHMIYSVKIIDQYGLTRKIYENKMGSKMLKINVADLKAGNYRISVFDGSNWSSKSFLIQK